MHKSFGPVQFLLLLFLLAAQASDASAQTSTDPTQTVLVSPTSAPVLTSDATPPIQLATPGEDGTIVHTVMAGESLISIADAYGIPFNDLLELNGFTMDAVIYPGDAIIVQAGFTATPSPPPSVTPTLTIVPTSTRRPTRTPLSQGEAGSRIATSTKVHPIITPVDEVIQSESDSVGTVLLVMIAILGLGGILMIVLGSSLRRNARKNSRLRDSQKVSVD